MVYPLEIVMHLHTQCFTFSSVYRRMQLNAGVSFFEEKIRAYGWLEGEYLLVYAWPAADSTPEKPSWDYFIEDRNTRHAACLLIDEIDKIPCQIVYLQKGVLMCLRTHFSCTYFLTQPSHLYRHRTNSY